MGVTIEARNKQRTYPRPNGPEVEFYLGKTLRGQTLGDKPQVIPINVNGHEFQAVMGQRNRLPKEVVDVLLNAKSQTTVTDVRAAEDRPRHQSAFGAPPTRNEYVQDYEIDIIKVSDK